MADVLLSDHLKELCMQIHQQHFTYLISISDDGQGKLEQREKLERCIREFLYIAPHNKKFTFPQTAQVLHRSASNKENFHKAASAWNAIVKYADNLFVYPWRKEFWDIKLYCGFYKHEIEENLTDAELMFEAMGYCHAGNSTMTMADVIDPDRIMNVSKDAIIAYVECQILKQIWENLSPYYNFTWLEILEFRENHTGTPDKAIRSLQYKRRQRQHEEQMYRRAQYQAVENHSRPEYVCPSNLRYINHLLYPSHSYSYPAQPWFAPHIVSPTSSVYPPMCAQHVIKPQDLYPPNGYHVPSHCYPMPDPYTNYHAGQQMSVPTGSLIQLDSAPVQEIERQRYPDEDLTSKWQEDKSDCGFQSGVAKAEDGAGCWDYRNMGIQGYKKDVKGGITAPKSNRSSNSDGKAQGELIEKFKKVSVGVSTSKSDLREEEEARPRSRKKSVREVEPERTSPEKKSPAKVEHLEEETQTDSFREPKSSKIFEMEQFDISDKWECIYCTYLNTNDKQVCDMCSKSKERGDESKPQPAGGQECCNCTLVNERGVDYCVACHRPLKDSPTYI